MPPRSGRDRIEETLGRIFALTVGLGVLSLTLLTIAGPLLFGVWIVMDRSGLLSLERTSPSSTFGDLRITVPILLIFAASAVPVSYVTLRAIIKFGRAILFPKEEKKD